MFNLIYLMIIESSTHEKISRFWCSCLSIDSYLLKNFSWLPVADKKGMSNWFWAICASPTGYLGYFGLFQMPLNLGTCIELSCLLTVMGASVPILLYGHLFAFVELNATSKFSYYNKKLSKKIIDDIIKNALAVFSSCFKSCFKVR